MGLDRSGRAVVALAFFLTGAAALANQITWQRTIAIHAGVDLESSTTVVAAFLAGLGIGSLVGGWVADRLSPRRALYGLAIVAGGVALCSLASTWVLYDLYQHVAASVDGPIARFLFNGSMILVPTVLAGTSLPLVARAVTTDTGSAASQIGRYNAVNTLGAAIGAFAAGWVVVGHHGLEGTNHLAAGAQATAALLFLGLARSVDRALTRTSSAIGGAAAAVCALAAGAAARTLIEDMQAFTFVPAQIGALGWLAPATGLAVAVVVYVVSMRAFAWGGATPEAPVGPEPVVVDAEEPAPESAAEPHPGVPAAGAVGPVWPWYAMYGVSGAVAIGYEQVFIRLTDGVMRSNSYTFAHVLGIYLVLLAAGNALGSWVRPRVHDHRRAFLWIQFGVAVSAIGGLIMVSQVLSRWLLDGVYQNWFSGPGLANGFDASGQIDLVVFAVGIPLVLMGAPVLLMGAAFPFAQGLVTRDLDEVGWRAGSLVAVNLVGNVTGALVTSYALIHWVGTVGAYRVLAIPLLAGGIAAAILARSRPARIVQGSAVSGVLLLGAFALPTNTELWATLHAREAHEVDVVETRSCVSSLVSGGPGRYVLSINGTEQNAYPFDDFHIAIGMLPALVHPDPQRALAIGFGIGSTSYALLSEPRVGRVDSVELCSGHYDLAELLADRGHAEFEVLTTSDRHDAIVGDGRRHLLVEEDRYDVIVPDTVRPSSAGSGNLYSHEFQQLVSERLADGGITAGWVSTFRALNSVASTFPHVVTVAIPSYGSTMYLASHDPITLDRDVLLERFDEVADDALPADQRARIRALVEDLEIGCVNDGKVPGRPLEELENIDLHPRDEYFLTNGLIGDGGVIGSCWVVEAPPPPPPPPITRPGG